MCGLRGNQGLAIVDESDGIRGTVTDGHDHVGVTATGRLPETQAGGDAAISHAGEHVHGIFGADLGVELNHFNHSMQVERDEVIGMIGTIPQADVLIGLESARAAVLDVLLHPLPPGGHGGE